MNKNSLHIGALVLAALGAVAWAKTEVKNPHWLSQADVAALIKAEPPPPAAGSDAEGDDLKEELDAQAHRTPEEIREANLDANYSVALFMESVEPAITAKAYPKTYAFFDALNKQIGEIVGAAKDHWKRPRPYLTHSEIHPLFQAGGYSYPSGHATHAYAFGTILGELFPDQATAFIDRAHLIAQSRVTAGVHYTSDIEEGQKLGREIAKELLTKPEFRQALTKAKAELAAKK